MHLRPTLKLGYMSFKELNKPIQLLKTAILNCLWFDLCKPRFNND